MHMILQEHLQAKGSQFLSDACVHSSANMLPAI